MPLIAIESSISDATLAEIYAMHRTELADLLEEARRPRGTPSDPMRLDQIGSLLEETLKLLGERGAPADRAQTIAAVNLTYDLLIFATEGWKRALGLPQVPRRRAASDPPAGATV
ncbi:MAG: hypothetical protein ACREBT_07270 [Thermoplasmata archaeon]